MPALSSVSGRVRLSGPVRETAVPPCNFCPIEALRECAWCDSNICTKHASALYVGDQDGVIEIHICPACRVIWNWLKDRQQQA